MGFACCGGDGERWEHSYGSFLFHALLSLCHMRTCRRVATYKQGECLVILDFQGPSIVKENFSSSTSNSRHRETKLDLG